MRRGQGAEPRVRRRSANALSRCVPLAGTRAPSSNHITGTTQRRARLRRRWAVGGFRMNAERAWEAALGQLQLDLPRASFDTWVRDAELLTYEDGTFVIGVQNAYARDWLEDRLQATVKKILGGLVGRTVEARFVIWQTESVEEDI